MLDFAPWAEKESSRHLLRLLPNLRPPLLRRLRDRRSASSRQDRASSRRPGNPRMLMRLAWIEIDQQRLADAFETINRADQIATAPLAEKLTAPAVARWQAQDHDTALIDFERAIAGHPEWTNPHWGGELVFAAGRSE